eukprot:TRINITY_DN1860_c0_g1_i1.p3 TRINITY_DN1860_c0_g1~~TRINITY_DN1860_c0_g1_i1.p3  ORF type:complete len:142 (-),score=21.09 TRINITY_DN1860_c0_g1_i1:330-755(-)
MEFQLLGFGSSFKALDFGSKYGASGSRFHKYLAVSSLILKFFVVVLVLGSFEDTRANSLSFLYSSLSFSSNYYYFAFLLSASYYQNSSTTYQQSSGLYPFHLSLFPSQSNLRFSISSSGFIFVFVYFAPVILGLSQHSFVL